MTRRGIFMVGILALCGAPKRSKARPDRNPPVFDERQRRQLWNGYAGSLETEASNPNRCAKAAREFLVSINQVPNWNLPAPAAGSFPRRPR